MASGSNSSSSNPTEPVRSYRETYLVKLVQELFDDQVPRGRFEYPSTFVLEHILNIHLKRGGKPKKRNTVAPFHETSYVPLMQSSGIWQTAGQDEMHSFETGIIQSDFYENGVWSRRDLGQIIVGMVRYHGIQVPVHVEGLKEQGPVRLAIDAPTGVDSSKHDSQHQNQGIPDEISGFREPAEIEPGEHLDRHTEVGSPLDLDNYEEVFQEAVEIDFNSNTLDGIADKPTTSNSGIPLDQMQEVDDMDQSDDISVQRSVDMPAVSNEQSLENTENSSDPFGSSQKENVVEDPESFDTLVPIVPPDYTSQYINSNSTEPSLTIQFQPSTTLNDEEFRLAKEYVIRIEIAIALHEGLLGQQKKRRGSW